MILSIPRRRSLWRRLSSSLWFVATIILQRNKSSSSVSACSRWFTSWGDGQYLARLNPFTGKSQWLEKFVTTDGNDAVVRTMAWDYSTQTIYCVLNGYRLATLKPMPQAEVELIGNGNSAGRGVVTNVRAMTVSQVGTLFAYSADDAGLYRIDKTTGEGNFLFDTNVPGITAMIFHVQRDCIYALQGGTNRVYMIVPQRKRVRLLGTIPGGGAGQQKIVSLMITPNGGMFGLTEGWRDPSTDSNPGEVVEAQIYRIVKRGESFQTEWMANTTLPDFAWGGTLQCFDALPPSVLPPSASSKTQPPSTAAATRTPTIAPPPPTAAGSPVVAAPSPTPPSPTGGGGGDGGSQPPGEGQTSVTYSFHYYWIDCGGRSGTTCDSDDWLLLGPNRTTLDDNVNGGAANITMYKRILLPQEQLTVILYQDALLHRSTTADDDVCFTFEYTEHNADGYILSNRSKTECTPLDTFGVITLMEQTHQTFNGIPMTYKRYTKMHIRAER